MNTFPIKAAAAIVALARQHAMSGKSPLFFIINDSTGQPPAGRQWFRVVHNEDTSKPVEILIYDQIGKSWWDDSGVGAKEFADELKTIAAGREIVVGINSPGGSVWDGLAIYHQLQARKDKVVCRVDGVAISAASFIACAGRELQMPKNTLMMIHEPAAMAAGSADEMRKAAEALDRHGEVIAGIYATKTGKTAKEMRAMMRDETWFTGDEAKACGLCDTVTDEVALTANFDFSGFRRVPKDLGKNTPTNSAAARSGAGNTIMTRAQVIALLKKHGIQYSENATDAELIALLDKIPTASATPASNPAPTPATPANPTAAPTPAANPAAGQPDANARITRMEQVYEAERRNRITAAVTECVSQCRIPAAQRDAWVSRAMADENVLNDIRALPQNLPGSEPVSALVEVTAESITDITHHFGRMAEPRQSFLRGNAVSARDIYNNAIAVAAFYAKVKARLGPVLNTNTIPTELKRQVILQEIMEAFAIRIFPVQAFSTVFQGIPLQGTNKIEVPYYDLDGTAASNFEQATGYTFGNSVTTFREVEVNKRKYKGLAFNSEELARQPYLNQLKIAQLAANKLGVDVFTDIMSIVTAANYGAAVINTPASAFDSDDVVDIGTACNQAMWPMIGRSLILDSAYDGNLKKDGSVKSALNFGTADVIRRGVVPELAGFSYYESPTIPANGEGLKGMAVFQSAALVATAPILPAAGVRKVLVNYDVIVHPQLGIAFEYRYWGEPQPDSDFEVIECNYGYAKGNGDALKRITTPA